MYPEFMQDIVRMNKMFELPVNKSIQLDKDLATKLYKLHNTLTDEVDELLDITGVLDKATFSKEGSLVDGSKTVIYPQVTIDHYVSLADLLGDMIVYCASEAVKHGIPIDDVLRAIMASQWSKLGANGEVIKDSNGKFLKGPNYKPPEDGIKLVLLENNRIVDLREGAFIDNIPKDDKDFTFVESPGITQEDYHDYDNISRN